MTTKETTRQRFERMLHENPNAVEEKSSGEGFIIPGVRPSRPKTKNEGDSDAQH